MSRAAPEVSNASPATLVERRVRSALAVARIYHTGIPLDRLSELLPPEGPKSPGDWSGWFDQHPGTGSVVDGRAVPEGLPPFLEATVERRHRGETYLAEAHRFLGGAILPARPLLRCLGVTGSLAYGEPERGDDCDFMAIARPGSVWVFLAYAYLAVRFGGSRPTAEGPAGWCFNWVFDEASAKQEYSLPHGFLFAREALMTRPLLGGGYYRGLVRSSAWLRAEAPRLFARWDSGPESSVLPPARPAPAAIRILNAILYPWLATYLQLVGLVRNARLRRRGPPEEAFRTITRFRRFALATEKYERLERTFGPASRLSE